MSLSYREKIVPRPRNEFCRAISKPWVQRTVMNAMFALPLRSFRWSTITRSTRCLFIFRHGVAAANSLVIPSHSKFNLLCKTCWHERAPQNERTRTFRQHEWFQIIFDTVQFNRRVVSFASRRETTLQGVFNPLATATYTDEISRRRAFLRNYYFLK